MPRIDTIADSLTMIRNASMIRKPTIGVNGTGGVTASERLGLTKDMTVGL